MATSTRRMRLTPDLVARVAAYVPASEASPPLDRPSDQEYRAMVAAIRAGAPAEGDLWLFGYGSLIWNPACAFVEERVAMAHGWHRSFCLGWTTVFRASRARPGLMLALDRGDRCEGLVYRLPPGGEDTALDQLVRREMIGKPHVMVPEWIDAETTTGPVRALSFVIDRASGLYVSGLAIDVIADALATAAGERGTMAEYLYETVRNLEQRGINDPLLWDLQDLVAARLERVGVA